MPNRVAMLAIVVLAFLASYPAQASLIGSTVTYANQHAPEVDGTFVVGSGIEETYCYFSVTSGSPCLLEFTLDYGPDSINFGFRNSLDLAFTALEPNSSTSTFGSGVNIVDAGLLLSTFPIPLNVSFTNNSVTLSHAVGWTWAANSNYVISIGVRTVPEPGTLSLLGAGLLALVVLRRKRTA